MKPILLLSMRQMGGRWRLMFIVLLAVLPVGLSALLSALSTDDPEFVKDFTNVVIDGLIIAAVLPIVVMVLATMAFGHELDDRTLGYLVTKPVPRSMIVLPKMMSSVVLGGFIVIASGVLATLFGPMGSGQAALAILVALFAGVVTYSAIFTWAGLISSRALGFALIYVFLWEGVVTSLLSGARYLSVRGYVLSILHGIDDDGFGVVGGRVIELPAAALGVVLVTLLFFWLSVRRLKRMDVP
ncbi:MAG: ABC transporter permease [Dehalococcoidia bacterium]